MAGCLTASAYGQTPASAATLTFTFERVGMPVPRFTLTLVDDGAGSGTYAGEDAARTMGPPGAALAPIAGQAFERTFMLSPSAAAKLFHTARELKMFNLTCASKAKHVASTGAKTLRYDGPDGKGSCAFDYSENKDVVALTSKLQAIAETMDEGRTLDHMRRFDRLGLDAELTSFAQQVTEGYAAEVETIAETLRAIAGNTEVMQRARSKAEALLASIPPDARP